MAEAVLQRQHQRLRAEQRRGTGNRFGGVERLHQHHDQVSHAHVVGIGGGIDTHLPLAVFVLHL
ncbi:hypothetical protein D3C81_1219860 [compost metagenome]